MMIDDEVNKPKWWQWLLFGIGAALVVAAAVVLTVTTGGAAVGLIGSIAVGAAKGALIGAAVGAVAGGLIGGATSGWTLDGMIGGALAGFGAGAIVGAIVGGILGFYSYQPTQITGFTKHGLNNSISRNGHGVNSRTLIKTIKNPEKIVSQSFNTKFKFIGKDAVVILNKTGKVITTWAKHKTGWRYMINLWLTYEYLQKKKNY